MRRLTVALLLALTVLAGCSPDDETASDAPDTTVANDHTEAEEDAPAAAMPDAQRAPQAADDGETAADATVRPASRAGGRRVVRTAEIELLAEDSARTSEDVMRLAERAGGFVATTDLRRDEENLLRGTITLRVPSDDLLEVLRGLEELAVRAPVSRIDEHDVTNETSDLEARLTNLTAYEQELRSLLADVREDTSSPDDLLRIFERIREVRAEVDTIEGRLASLADQVELATVSVSIEPAPSALAVADPTWQPLETVHEAMTAAVRGLSRLADAAIWLTVGVLPVVAILALPVLALLAVWRRARTRTAAPTPEHTG